jgi:hypothetical protein
MVMKPKVLDHWMHGDNQPSFGVEIYDHSKKYSHDIKFYKFYTVSGRHGGECTLKEGRFRGYTEDRQGAGVVIKKNDLSQGEMHEWFNAILEWIAEQVDERWSLDIEVHDVHKMEFEFRFSELTVAVLFRFLFQ